MLVNRSIQLMGQFTTKAHTVIRNSSYIQRPNLSLFRLQGQRKEPQQILLDGGNGGHRFYRMPSTFQSTIKPQLNPKHNLKGSVCLVLFPVSTFSLNSLLNAPVVSSTALFSTSSSGAKKSDNQAESIDMASEDYKNANSIYDFTVKDTHGNDVSLDKYKGHVVLIVNIASQCGLTKNNYKKLTDLKEKYHDKGLRILNFPCNQFGSQMPEQDGEPMVCHLRDAKADIGDVFQKVEVNGSGAAPLYQFLKAKQGGTLGSALKWNFTKFLVNKEGIPVNRYAPTTDPMDIAKDIEKLL